MNQFLELCERVEKATGPDRELDVAIHTVATSFESRIGGVGWPEGALVVPAFPGWKLLPDYTKSLDAAMTLVPEGYVFGVGSWGNPDTDGPWAWCATEQQSADNDLDYGKAATPALALTAAALRARGSD